MVKEFTMAKFGYTVYATDCVWSKERKEVAKVVDYDGAKALASFYHMYGCNVVVRDHKGQNVFDG